MNAYRHLSGHLEQLGATLVGLGRQMRDSVATAVSRSAAEALRQGLASLLRQSGEGPGSLDEHRPFDPSPRLGNPYRRGIPPRSDWGEPDRLDNWDAPDESRWDRREASDWRGHTGDFRDDRDDRGNTEPQQPRNGWRLVLAAGSRLVAWLLGRLAKPGRVLAALGVGLATGLAVWLAGPGAGPGPLSALTDAVTCGADALAYIGTR
jgi:hypothetical protein